MARAKKDAESTSTPKKSTRTKKPVATATSGAAAAPAEERAQETNATKTSTKALIETANAVLIDEQQVRTRAYELYIERGATDGNDMEDWLRAEAELRGKIA